MPSAAPAVENGAGPPKSELEELQIKANQVTDEVIKKQLNNIIIINININSIFNYSRLKVPAVCWPYVKR